MICVRVPGKLFIAGEYAITHSTHQAIVTAVPYYLTVTVTKSEQLSVTSSLQPNKKYIWSRKDNQSLRTTFPYVMCAILICEQFLIEKGYAVAQEMYHIEIISELDSPTGEKYGLGSSGAVTVAIVKAILTYFGYDVIPLIVYKLAVLAQMKLKSNGSFGDLAASSYGGLIAYTLFDRNWLEKFCQSASLATVVENDWKDLCIETLVLPTGAYFIAGWTGTPASTEALVHSVKQQKESTAYQQFLAQSKACMTAMIHAFNCQDIARIEQTLQTYQHLLIQLSPQIQTPKLKRLCEIAKKHSCVAKTSGAGGGDCGICLVKDEQMQKKIEADWRKEKIIPLGDLRC